MATHAATRNLCGLARALAQHGLMPEVEAEALQTQAQSAGITFVEQLLTSKRFTAQQVAVFGSRAFGVPLLDLASFDLDQFQKEYFDAKISQTRRVLPLAKRGNRLFVAVSDPANLQALEEVRFKTNLVVEPVIVEDDKLGSVIHKILEASGATLKDAANLDDLDVDMSETGGATTLEEDAEVEDAPVVKYIQKILLDAIAGRRLRHPLRALRALLPDPLPGRRHPVGGRAAAARDQGQGRVADQGRQPARHRREARAAGRPHEAHAVEEQGDRLPRVDAADALRREDRDADPRLRRASSSASRRWATSPTSSRRCSPRSGGPTG